MRPVRQEEQTGCAIASAAALAGVSYQEAKTVANRIGVYATDPALWSETHSLRELLAQLGLTVSNNEVPFMGWDALPNLALLSLTWHRAHGKPYWHWGVFIREGERRYVLDSKTSLTRNIRTDFGRMKPKWSIAITASQGNTQHSQDLAAADVHR